MKTYFIQHSLTKVTLAALAAAITLLAVAPAHADTSWMRGGNRATSGGDPYNLVYPDGITSSTTPTQAAAVADTIANDYHDVGINFVRISVDPATVSSPSNDWSMVQAYINELITDGLYVDICCSYIDQTSGLIPDTNTWESMWRTVDGVYANNNMVYYEPINESHGYSSADLRNNVYAVFLGYGLGKSQSYYILDGVQSAGLVADIGGDSRFDNCLLTVHDYPTSGGYNTVSGWESELAGQVSGYQSRTMLTEMGAVTDSGLDYEESSSDSNICFVQGLCAQCLAWPMGAFWFPADQAIPNDKKMFNGPGDGIINRSLVNEMQYGWDFFTPVSAALCDFNVIGQTAYPIYRPSNDTFYVYPAGGLVAQWGANGDIAVPADYNGTGKAQFAVWRPSNDTFYVYPTGGLVEHWGTNGDVPVPGDYTGAGYTQVATWGTTNFVWNVNGVATNTWGTTGDVPLPLPYAIRHYSLGYTQ